MCPMAGNITCVRIVDEELSCLVYVVFVQQRAASVVFSSQGNKSSMWQTRKEYIMFIRAFFVCVMTKECHSPQIGCNYESCINSKTKGSAG